MSPIDTELDAVCGGHHGHFDFGNIGNIGNFNFGNIVIEPIIAVQVGVAVGGNASVTQLLGQLNFSSIVSDALGHLPGPQTLSVALPLLGHA